MTERDYILVANVARLHVLQYLVQALIRTDEIPDVERGTLMRLLDTWTRRTERAITKARDRAERTK